MMGALSSIGVVLPKTRLDSTAMDSGTVGGLVHLNLICFGVDDCKISVPYSFLLMLRFSSSFDFIDLFTYCDAKSLNSVVGLALGVRVEELNNMFCEV